MTIYQDQGIGHYEEAADMRVLCSSTPMEGVLTPLIPVAKALRDAGHDVVIAVAEDLAGRVADDGLESVAAGPGAFDAALRAFADPWVADAPPEEHWRLGAAMFASVMAPEKLIDLQDFANRWQPDLVLHAAVDLAAPLLAAERGIPSVTYGLGLLLERALLDAMTERVTPMWRRAGLRPPEHAGLFRYRYLDPIPRSLQPDLGPAAAVAEPVRPPVPGDRRAALPSWFDRLGGRPVVYVSLGTVPVFNQPSTFATLLGDLAADDLDLIVTVGPTNDPASLGAQPANVHVEQWLPLAPLLPRCDAVICHGGAGTTLAALSCGLPLVLAPQGADQFVTADACEAAGVARVLRPNDLSASATRTATSAILGNSPERSAAGRLRAEIEAMPSPADAVRDIEDLLVHC